MKLTTKGKFAVTAVLDIALYSDNNQKPVKLAHVSERQQISLSYLEQLFGKLRKKQLVKSYKGPGGGYLLNQGVAQISIAQIIQAVDEDLDARTCHGEKNCHAGHHGQCLTHELWNGLTMTIYQYLAQITVNDLLNQAKKRQLTIPFATVLLRL